MRPKWIWMGISSIVFLVGLVLIFFGLRDILQAQASVGWQPVAGVIVSSDLGVEDDGDGNTLYRANIHYAYNLDGSPAGMSFTCPQSSYASLCWNGQYFATNNIIAL